MRKDYKKTILITGGCGFIGSHVVRHFVNNYPDYLIVNIDRLSTGSNIKNLIDIEDKPNYTFKCLDICDYGGLNLLFDVYNVDGVIHLAAESHVDRSISDPLEFVKTNVIGTVNLLDVAKNYWSKSGFEGKRFYHISTDEVYGDLEITHPNGFKINGRTYYGTKFFAEYDKYNPHSPYSASKASSDHFVRAYHDTYGLPIVISNCSNNYGPNQYHEKLIPLVINKIVNNESIPVYGNGLNVRDWLYVGDHVNAIDLIFHQGENGETYNIGGNNERTNIEVVKLLCKTCDKILGRPEGESEKLITYVEDRLGHDLRYAIYPYKIENLGWKPEMTFEEGIEKTIKSYLK